MGTVYTRKMFKECIRPDWAGDVIISDNIPGTANIAPQNPRNVMGIIVPVTTKGRPSAPRPLSGQQTGASIGTDKGHMMALELGGPDISENIAPQTNRWQQSGGWRAIEVVATKLAMEWMGITSVYDPGSTIPPPTDGAFFRVAPSSSKLLNGEPEYYEGTVTKISIITGGKAGDYRAHSDWLTHIFRISPGGVEWSRKQEFGASPYK